jgi:hypothetical protein
MSPNFIYRLTGTVFIACVLAVTSCSKEGSQLNPDSKTINLRGSVKLTGAPEKYTKKIFMEATSGSKSNAISSTFDRGLENEAMLDSLYRKYQTSTSAKLIPAIFHTEDQFEIGTDKKALVNFGHPKGYGDFFTGYSNKQVWKGFGCILEKQQRLVFHDGFYIGNPEASALEAALNKPATLGLAISSSVDAGKTLNLNVMVGMGQDLNAKAKIAIYLTQDVIVPKQNNVYSKAAGNYDDDLFVPGGYMSRFRMATPTIINYRSNNVVRDVLVSAKGNEIPAQYSTKGAIYSQDFKIDISKYMDDPSRPLKIVAVVYAEDGNGVVKETYNAQMATAGQNQDFD